MEKEILSNRNGGSAEDIRSESMNIENQEEYIDFDYKETRSYADCLTAIPSWFVSMVVHAGVLLLLALITVDYKTPIHKMTILSDSTPLEEFVEIDEDPLLDEPLNVEIADDLSTEIVETAESETAIVAINPAASDMTEATAVNIDLASLGMSQDDRLALGKSASSIISSNGFGGRTGNRNRIVLRCGGDENSERAVAHALAWLAEHQLPDGSWNFNHQICLKCKGQCRNPGSMMKAQNAATAMALLPFLGAGQTSQKGKYAKTVRAGLYYLASHGKIQNGGVSFFEPEGRMYSHGLAAICMTEGYAMTKDHSLLPAAQGAINFIVYAQDPIGGGWRYTPKQAGDASVVGWQLMGLKSGFMAYLQVDPKSIANAARFLDSVQTNSGANYGYTEPGSGNATTAIGLLCRMYLGWKRDNPSLAQGVQGLAKLGPSKDNNYYNYDATQVLRQYGSDLWKDWNAVMRDQLVNSQIKTGHEKGSWSTNGPHASNGGRLYDTSLSTMVLEVYYRHMPIYRNSAVESEFPL